MPFSFHVLPPIASASTGFEYGNAAGRWTPVAQCQALFDRIAAGRELLETHVYPGAHHSFDALGLPVRYLAGAGNRSKPGGCCGAHYGANEAAWQAFVGDVKAFLAKSLSP